MNTMIYPACFAPVVEEEMVYITGGAEASLSTTENDPIYTGIMLATMIGSFIGVVAIIGAINDGREKRLRTKYEEQTGLSAVDEAGNLTSDFSNYKKRAEGQGRDVAASFSVGVSNFLADNYAVIIYGALLGTAFLYMKCKG